MESTDIPDVAGGPRVAVLGAGYIGLAVARDCVARGAAVWAVRRRARPSAAGIESIAGDLVSGVIPELPGALDAIVLAVAPAGGADSYDSTYPPAARTAVALARATGARSLVYTSSTGVYGGQDGAWIEESAPRRGEGPGNRALMEAEDILLEAGLDGVTVLRIAGIYGPGRDPRPRFAQARLLPSGGEYWVNLAHQVDIVAAITDSLVQTGPPRVLNVSDGAPATAAQIARWCAAAQGLDPAALVFDGQGSLSRSNQRIANAALVATGWQPRFPSFREGFTAGLSG
jgi:nucleoside-diphosphate-sugar epimerase